MGALFASLGDVPFDAWERRPRELLTLPEAVSGPVDVADASSSSWFCTVVADAPLEPLGLMGDGQLSTG